MNHVTFLNKVYKVTFKNCKRCQARFFSEYGAIYCSVDCRIANQADKPVNRAPSLLSAYIRYDRAHQLENDLTVEYINELITSNSCVYCACLVQLGLDRIDNSKGHLKSNVLVACARCNRFRANYLTVEEMIKVVKLIKSICYDYGY